MTSSRRTSRREPVTKAAFRYCRACGWEGHSRETCPDCGAETEEGGVVIF